MLAPSRIIAEKGSKEIGQGSIVESGTLVTAISFINATGGSLSPVLILYQLNVPKICFAIHVSI